MDTAIASFPDDEGKEKPSVYLTHTGHELRVMRHRLMDRFYKALLRTTI